MEFRAQEGRDPDIDHVDTDADKLKEIAVKVLKSLGISEDFLDLDFTVYVLLVCCYIGMYCYGAWYGDGAGNTIEENSSVFSLIRMR